MGDGNADILELLIRHELALKELYGIFAAAFPGHQDLWNRMVADEQKHADLLGTLRGDRALDKWSLPGSPLKPQAIKASLGYVESQIIKAREGKFTVMQALSVARDLENALLEKQIAKLGESPSGGIQSVARVLVAETTDHRNALIEAIGGKSR